MHLSKLIDISSKRFGRLVVLSRDESQKYRHPRWICKCDCGNEKIIRGNDLHTGKIKSCGCIRKELITTHGLSYCSLYPVWAGIKQRCYNTRNKFYKDYGGRGILMWDEWGNSFENFHNWALWNGYEKGLTIERTWCNYINRL